MKNFKKFFFENVELDESEAAYKKADRDEKRKAGTGEYYVTNHDMKKTHSEPFKTSDQAISHANAQEDKTGYIHTVHHIKNGKIQKQWQYSDSAGRFAPYNDHAGQTAHIHEETDLDEAGAFSYGAKVTRKGSSAYNAMMMRKQQEKNQKPIEPKDQMVGNAKVTKEEVEQIDEISKKLAKSYLDKSAAERESNPNYSTREKFRGRMIGGATADAKLKGRVEQPYKFGQAPKRKMYVKVGATNEEVELDENIKGWKHAASDIQKMRSAQGKAVKLVRLKKDGAENKMHDATKMFRSEDEAKEHHDRVVVLNPKTKIAHNLYVDGKHVKTLGA